MDKMAKTVSNRMFSGVAIQIATLGPVGRLPVAPGTWGSGAAAILWWWLAGVFQFALLASFIVLLAILSIIVSTIAEQRLGCDARPIVIDEVVGQWLALLWCPHSWIWFAGGFVLFRVFDIFKPFPVRASQKLPGGWGVTIDDILAGLYAALCLYFIGRFFDGLGTL